MFELIKKNLVKFLIIWFAIFLGSFYLLSFFGFVPEFNPSNEMPKSLNQEDLDKKLLKIEPTLPQRIVIEKIGVDVAINNPRSRNINILDDALLSGAVRYPSSGLLGEKTNMLLFGHSSNLPVVRNSNFKAFNKLNKLENGDRFSIFSGTHEFIYSIKSVSEADAQNALVVFESDKREVTLSTCNTFGNLNDRFVVRADLVDIIEI